MTAQAQAEDRRAQIQAKLTRIGNLVANLAHPNVLSGMFIESGDHRQNNLEDEAHDLLRELLAELSRLSRVEQALREALSFFADETLLDAVDDDTMSGIRPCPPSTCMRIRDVRRWHQALTASPEAQPEEGR